jgi:hypothetical protein
MSDKYLLCEDHSVRATDDLMEWAKGFEKSDRHVGSTLVGDVHISTVFLGLDHSFGDGPPLLFETMIFGGKHNQKQWRYSTWDEAVAGHEAAVKLASDSD